MKQRGTVRFTGHDKNAGLVYLETKHGFLVRKEPAKGSHADDKNLKENSGSAGPINRLAGEIARTMRLYANGFVPKGLYHAIKSRFFKTQYLHRFIWLNSLEGMDANPQNSFADAIGLPGFIIRPEAERLIIKTTIKQHANFDKFHRFYSLNIILVSWNNEDEKISHTGKYSAWQAQTKEPPFSFTFDFERPANMTDYLVLCSCLRTEGKNEEMYPPDKALKVIAVGSFDEKAVAELEDYRAKKADDRKQYHKNLVRRDESQAVEPDVE